MHLGAALGVRVTALFGPTDERATRPLGRSDAGQPTVITHDVWCRPCLLRECPLTQRCMHGIGVARSRRPGSNRLMDYVPAAFLDRDGTIIEEVGYLDRPERVELFPWSGGRDSRAEPGRRARGSGVEPVGRCPRVLRRGDRRPGARQVGGTAALPAGRTSTRITIVRTIPTARSPAYARACDCRKPARGLVDRAVRELRVDPRCSFTVGDRWLDVALARTVGARGILVRTGYGQSTKDSRPTGCAADAVVDNLIEAVGWILGALRSQSDKQSE